MKKLNLNECVGVKFTDEGLKILEEQYNNMLKRVSPSFAKELGEFKPPVVDEDGYCNIQLAELMLNFGCYMFNGNYNLPFEMEIKISEEKLIEEPKVKTKRK